MKISLERLFDDHISYIGFDFQEKIKTGGLYGEGTKPPVLQNVLQFVFGPTEDNEFLTSRGVQLNLKIFMLIICD